MEDYFIGVVGIDPDSFWSNTWTNNHRLSECYTLAKHDATELVRYLAFTQLQTAFDANGRKIYKNINKPSDLFALKGESKPSVLEGEAANNLMKQLTTKK